ncbi:MAG: metallophosphoesterase [Saprospirales bacterium]|nr:MAG: metallophosphoesterase [Saprospirales bacterium]
MTLFFLILFVSIVFLLELYVFRILFSFCFRTEPRLERNITNKIASYFDSGGKITFTIIYWTLIIALPINMFLHFQGIIEPYEFKPWIYVNAFFFIFAITRLSLAFYSGIADIIGWLDNKITKSSDLGDYDPGRKSFIQKMALLVGILPFPTLTYGMIRNPYRYRVRENIIGLKDLDERLEGLRIVQISDIHSGSWVFKSPVETAIKKINELKPDLVFFTGDLVNYKASEMEPFVEFFSQIESTYGVYSVLGNHDYGEYYRWDSKQDQKGNFQEMLNVHKRMGWKLLRNENEIININGAELAVIGVENYSALPQFPNYGDLSLAYEGTKNAEVRILLSHDPTHWDAEVRKYFEDIHITLSGHTHGFQFGFEIPGFVRWSPSSLVYNQWAGLYQSGSQYLYVNRGLGFLGYPGRVGILPEITFIELRDKKEDLV